MRPTTGSSGKERGGRKACVGSKPRSRRIQSILAQLCDLEEGGRRAGGDTVRRSETFGLDLEEERRGRRRTEQGGGGG